MSGWFPTKPPKSLIDDPEYMRDVEKGRELLKEHSPDELARLRIELMFPHSISGEELERLFQEYKALEAATGSSELAALLVRIK